MTCRGCGHQLPEQAAVCPQCGRRVEYNGGHASGIRQVGWVIQMIGGLSSLIGMVVLLVLTRPEVEAAQRAAIWRIGLLFALLGIFVSVLGWLAPRLWTH